MPINLWTPHVAIYITTEYINKHYICFDDFPDVYTTRCKLTAKSVYIGEESFSEVAIQFLSVWGFKKRQSLLKKFVNRISNATSRKVLTKCTRRPF